MTLLFNLGSLYRNQQNHAQAEGYFLECYERRKSVLGGDHDETSVTMYNLGQTYFKNEKFDMVEPLMVKYLKSSLAKKLGDDHIMTLHSIHYLSLAYWGQSKSAQAEVLFQDVITRFKRFLGDDHPLTLQYMTSLATIYTKQAKYNQAEPLLVECLSKLRVKLGYGHKDTVAVMDMLRDLYRNYP